MTIYWAGGEIGAVIPSTSGPLEVAAASVDRYDTAFARCYINASGGGSSNPDNVYLETPAWASQTVLWHHAYNDGLAASVVDAVVWELFDGAGTAVIRLKHIASGDLLNLEYLNASAVWTVAGSVSNFPDAGGYLDLYHSISSGGVLALYAGGTQNIYATGLPLSHITGIVKSRFRSGWTYCAWSDMIVASISTIGWRLVPLPISGAGATSGWTGAYTTVDEIPYSDADFISSSAANDISTFATTAPSFTGYRVRGVVVTARSKCGAAGPQNLQLALRVAAVNYFSATKAQTTGYGASVNVWETNPATTLAWDSAAMPAIEPGVKSIA